MTMTTPVRILYGIADRFELTLVENFRTYNSHIYPLRHLLAETSYCENMWHERPGLPHPERTFNTASPLCKLKLTMKRMLNPRKRLFGLPESTCPVTASGTAELDINPTFQAVITHLYRDISIS